LVLPHRHRQALPDLGGKRWDGLLWLKPRGAELVEK